jgi:DNA modification methylase
LIAADLQPLARRCDTLTLMPGNPRQGNVAAVARSLEAFGQRKPIVANRDGVVLAGNHTLLAARELGWTHIAVVAVDSNEVDGKAYALADNRVGDLGGYDEDALVAMLTDVADADTELLASLGWSDAELRELLAPTDVPLTDPDDVPPPPAEPVSKLGDLWLLGEHRLLCGDAADDDAFVALLGDAQADVVWTDPPYGVSYVGKTSDALTIANDERGDAVEHEAFLRRSLGAALAHTRPGATWYVTAPSGPALLGFMTALCDLGVLRQLLVWVKDRFVLGHSDYHYRHEDILYGWTPGAAHHAVPDRTQDSVWEFDRPSASRQHPTMKPVALIVRALQNSSNHGALVLDPFGGSGSTLIACQDSGRVARLVEVDPTYCDVACLRYQQHTGQLPVLASTGKAHDFNG